MKSTELNIEELEAISNGSFSDPFGLFGVHSRRSGKGYVVRTFQPHARTVVVVPSRGKAVEAKKITPEGLYEATFPTRKQRFEYSLDILYAGKKKSVNIEDPHRFGSLIEDVDVHLWAEGTHTQAWNFMGAHPKRVGDIEGTHFVVWAPNAHRVSVVGDFNQWDGRRHGMRCLHSIGVWEIFLPGIAPGESYKYELQTSPFDAPFLKADPYAQFAEIRPNTASVVWKSDFAWSDHEWLKERRQISHHEAPISIYELHAGSWRRDPSNPERLLSYQEIAEHLIPYVKDLGFTHVELMPLTEFPYDPSWGYQVTGFFAPTSRYGSPDDLKYLVNECHNAGIGVILDWVPAHFTKDDHGLRRFDGTALYEHEDPRLGEHKDWGTAIFNYGRTEVLNFLLSSANYWIQEFHMDGLRVDAVASMLYLDYSREDGEWIPNKHGGRENLEAIHFLQRFNTILHEQTPGICTFAEESTSWQGVTRPVHYGGLGFDFKWNMGWMNDTLTYMERDPVYRKFHHQDLTFSLIYAFSEQFVLPFSHDEVVHGKGSLASKMPGDDWKQLANLRLLLAYQYGHPGKKLLFMGQEFGQWDEWTEAHSLDWHLMQWDRHQGIQRMVKDLNHLLQEEPALHKMDHHWEGFEWIDFQDHDRSLLSFLRKTHDPKDSLLCVCNFTPSVVENYTLGAPKEGPYEVLFNSDSTYYGGSNVGGTAPHASPMPWQGQPTSLSLTLPPLAMIILKPSTI